MTRRLATWPRTLIAVCLACPFAGLHAHPAEITTLEVTVSAAGELRGVLNVDLLSFALQKPSADTSNEELEQLLDGPKDQLERDLKEADAYLGREIVLSTDNGDVSVRYTDLPGLQQVEAILSRKIAPRIIMPGTVAFQGQLPAGSKTFSIRLPFILGDTLHYYQLPSGRAFSESVLAGKYSTPVSLAQAFSR